MIALNNVLVAVDFGEASEAALTYARNFARNFGARLHILHVMENTFLRLRATDPRVLETAATRQLVGRLTDADRRTLRAVTVIRTSDAPAEEIVQYAKDEQIDLIVMGTHGRAAVAHLLMGSVAERVVRTAPCPVLTVRHPEHEFVLPDNEVRHDRVEEHPRRD